MDLFDLAPGKRAYIDSLTNTGSDLRRLLDMGFTPGALITCLFAAPSGDPKAYLIRGSVIALRSEDASHITI